MALWGSASKQDGSTSDCCHQIVKTTTITHNDDHDGVDDVTDVDSCLDDDRDEGDDDDKNQWVCSRRPVLVCMVILPQG